MIFNKEKEKKALYKEVFNSEAGQEVLHDIMRHNYVFNSTQVEKNHKLYLIDLDKHFLIEKW